jgi:serine/threonine protein kinase
MTLTRGTQVGSYEVIGTLGAGGMGEVYRARDTRLNRDVALKVLPADVANDGDRLARFRREAQLLAALNHPHIAAIYGFDDSGVTPELVLELVDGPTLADRIAAVHCRSMKRCSSPGRSPKRSRRHTYLGRRRQFRRCLVSRRQVPDRTHQHQYSGNR